MSRTDRAWTEADDMMMEAKPADIEGAADMVCTTLERGGGEWAQGSRWWRSMTPLEQSMALTRSDDTEDDGLPPWLVE